MKLNTLQRGALCAGLALASTAPAWPRMCSAGAGVLGLSLVLASSGAAAQGLRANSTARVWMQVQPLSLQIRSDARFPGFEEAQLGTPVQLESELGLPGRTGTTAGSLTLRIGQRWRVEASYLELGRSGRAVLNRDVDIGDFRFTAGTALNSSVSLRTLRVNAGWSLLQAPQTEAGVMLGGRAVFFSSSFSGTGRSLVNTPDPAASGSGTFDVAPVPVFGGYVSHAFNAAWQVDGRLDSGLSGNNITEWQADACWRPQHGLRLGLGYRYLDARLNTRLVLTGSTSRITASLRAHGPQLTLEALY